jgi:hypothetical protein
MAREASARVDPWPGPASLFFVNAKHRHAFILDMTPHHPDRTIMQYRNTHSNPCQCHVMRRSPSPVKKGG